MSKWDAGTYAEARRVGAIAGDLHMRSRGAQPFSFEGEKLQPSCLSQCCLLVNLRMVFRRVLLHLTGAAVALRI